MTNSNLPHHPAAMVWVKRVHDPRLLGGNQISRAIRKRSQDWRRAKVEIISGAAGAIGPVGSDASNIPSVLGGELLRPEHLSGAHVESHHCVRIPGVRLRIAVACGHVNCVGLHVDRRRGPYRGAGRPPKFSTGGISPARCAWQSQGWCKLSRLRCRTADLAPRRFLGKCSKDIADPLQRLPHPKRQERKAARQIRLGEPVMRAAGCKSA